MKRRNGFVSNSSSSSFCAYGLCVEGFSEYDEDGEPKDDIDKILKGTCLDYMTDDDGNLYVGRSPSSIEDNETGKEFKERAKQDILKCFPDVKVKDIDWVQEVIYG